MYVCTKSFLKTTTNSSCVCTHLANKADSDSDSDSDSDVSHFRGCQGCQVFATKPAQLLLKTSPIAFRGGFPGKVRIPGAKYHVIGVASTRGHEKQPAATVLK